MPMISRAAIEEAAKAWFWRMHSIMHDHEKHWRDFDKKEIYLDCAEACLSAALAAEGMALVPVEALSYARQMSNLCFNYKQSSHFDEKTRRNFDEVQSGFDRAMLKAAGASDAGK